MAFDPHRIARLARLELDAAEAESLRGELERILEYVEKLGEVETSGVEPTSHLGARATPMRPDEPADSLGTEVALAAAPERAESFFEVPRILEDD